jgi:hypothetical protein
LAVAAVVATDDFAAIVDPGRTGPLTWPKTCVGSVDHFEAPLTDPPRCGRVRLDIGPDKGTGEQQDNETTCHGTSLVCKVRTTVMALTARGSYSAEGQDSYRLAQATAGKGVKPLA